MKIFISHKQQDADTANQMASELRMMGVEYYLDLVDSVASSNGKELTSHIKRNLNNCTDIIVIMSNVTRLSQWVPFEVGMAAQRDMPTATFLQEDVSLPEFLEYWPRLKRASDIRKYVMAKNDVNREYQQRKSLYENVTQQTSQTERFYQVLKQRL